MNNYEMGQLLTRIQEGDISAYEVLYSNTYTLVCSVAYSVLHDQSAAEDIAQNVFSTIWNHKTAYQHSRNPNAWLYTLAHNAAVDYVKSRKHELSVEEPLLLSSHDTETPENTVIASERIEQLFAVLTEPERKILVLHRVVGLKHREIAKMLNLPLGTVLSKYQNSLRKMRQHDEKDA